MGEVIQFPDEEAQGRGGRYVDVSSESATVIILPVIRIDRGPDSGEPGTGRRRRRSGR